MCALQQQGEGNLGVHGVAVGVTEERSKEKKDLLCERR
jgi:hypothetical protein